MRNYKIKHSKRSIKKVFKRVFGEVKFMLAVHGMKPDTYCKPTVNLMRYLLINYWHYSL